MLSLGERAVFNPRSFYCFPVDRCKLMAAPSADDVIQAFVAIVRDELVSGESLHVPGLGTFSVEHRASEMKEMDDGPNRMLPPRDVVRFEPDE